GALPAAAATRHDGGHGDIPVAGFFANPESGAPGTGVDHGIIHAVVRIPHGTAVFSSVGGSDLGSGASPRPGLSMDYYPTDVWDIGLVDAAHCTLYQPMLDAAGDCLCNDWSEVAASTDRSSLNVGWAVMAPLPKGV